ncbi:hypothetical protein Q5P01_002813 [Channa striata]|uniref:C2H2-type domain-containing protein n=1 Tax=Channa striata TaxID=64152 RepID=A0AA88NRR7_CHASR|nr:hypothetical protein Q5P01_002813 [Channa striata]
MKRGSSVLQPPSDAAKRHTHPANAHTKTHTSDDACSLSVSDTLATGSSPFPAATSLFSPDVSTKMASDLLIRLSEATQKAQVHPGSRGEAVPQQREALMEVRGGQQDEPGLALSPDGPGASPEPPSLTHTPDGNAAADTLASDLLRKLAERQEENCRGVRIKEEEEPVDVDTMVVCDLIRDQPISNDMTTSTPKITSHHLFTIKPEDHGLIGNKMSEPLHSGVKIVDQCLLGAKIEDTFFSGGCQAGSKMVDGVVSGANKFQIRVKMEDHGVSGTNNCGPKVKDQILFKAKIAERPFSGTKMSNKLLSGVKMEERSRLCDKTEDQDFSRTKTEEHPFFGAKVEEQFTTGAKMADQCLRAVLWQDMSVNLASTLLHQLSERVSKSNNQPAERSTPTIKAGKSRLLTCARQTPPSLKVNVDPLRSSPLLSSQDPPRGTQTSRDQNTGCPYFYRCHICGFETDRCALFQSHMMEHRPWEHSSFSLHCCMCDHSTNQEAEMRVHTNTHIHGETGISREMRCPVAPPAAATSSSAPAVAMATQPEKSTSEHRCRICQRSFPGQQELLVHFQGHRQGNQYRCDRCGHLTRTANKLVEHVRVHTGERPFNCDLCPYSAKRRDSLRLHCKVKHAAHVNGNVADTPGDVHTHRSYVHGDNQRSNKHVQRLHTPPSTHTAAPSSFLHPSLSDRAGWRDLSPLLPITTLISLKPRSSSPSSSSSSSSNKHSFLGYLGLTTSL